LNLYCDVDDVTGKWTCNLCDNVNPTLKTVTVTSTLDDDIRGRYEELQHRHTDFEEQVFLDSGVSNEWDEDNINQVLVLAFDGSLCDDFDALTKFLQHVLTSIPQKQRVAIMTFGKCINFVRLCGGLSESVAVDALPGDGDYTGLMRHFFSQGVYLTPASVALREAPCIAKTLVLVSGARKGSSLDPYSSSFGTAQESQPLPTTADAIVAAALSLGAVKGSPGVRLLLATGHSLSLTAEALAGEPEVAAFSRLGRKAFFPVTTGEQAVVGSGGCWIDVLRIGYRGVQSDSLDALCGSSGGMMFRSNSLADTHLLRSVAASLQLDTSRFPTGGTVCTLEIRTSEGLQIAHVIGPVLSAQDAKGIAGLRLDLAAVDVRHLAHSVSADCADAVSLTDRTTGAVSTFSRAVYKRLYERNQKRTLVCGMTRLDPNITVSVQCTPTDAALRRSRVSMQCVVRYVCPTPRGGGAVGSAHTEVVRVMNSQLSCTTDKELFLQALDAELWSVLVARSIVADFHSNQIARNNDQRQKAAASSAEEGESIRCDLSYMDA
jgi:hypothetical protein